MQPTPSTILLEDAVAILESIRRAVLLDLQQPNGLGVYEEMGAEIDALRTQIEETASLDVAKGLEDLGSLVRTASESGLERTKLEILDVISSLEAILVNPDPSELELLELIDTSFGAFAGTPVSDSPLEEDPVLDLDLA